MIRRVPIIPTLIVLAAVAVMVRLGFWQLDRLGQKEALIERLRANAGNPEAVAYPSSSTAAQPLLYRRSMVDCGSAAEWQSVSGRNVQGQDGWVHIVRCPIAEGRTADIVAGWSRGLVKPQWTGGAVTGYVSPGGMAGTRLVADPPLAGLIANARPDPASLSNNHLSYAAQWFLFALTALVIYALALRKKLKSQP